MQLNVSNEVSNTIVDVFEYTYKININKNYPEIFTKFGMAMSRNINEVTLTEFV